MTNRILHWMLVFALLANQAAICGAHTHHGAEPANHSARTHVHLSGHSHDHDSHDHDSHHDHDSIDHQHSDHQPPNDSESGLETRLPADHDRDAIFFGDQDDFQIQPSRLATAKLSSVSTWILTGNTQQLKPVYRSRLTRAGPYSMYRCAIYLKTSRLLI